MILEGTRMVISSIRALEGRKTSSYLVISPFAVFTAPRNINSMAKIKRSGKITLYIMMLISNACHIFSNFFLSLPKSDFKTN